MRNNYKETSQAEFDSLLSAVLKEKQRKDDLIYVTEAQIDRIREKYRGNYEESLPMGVHFGNSEKEYDKRYNSLLNQGEIFHDCGRRGTTSARSHQPPTYHLKARARQVDHPQDRG